MVTNETTKTRRRFSRGAFWGALFLLGGLACIGHAIVVPASKHDVSHGVGPQGPETTYSTPWAWALGGGVLILGGLGKLGYARYGQRDDGSE
jgi:hypothetical protein